MSLAGALASEIEERPRSPATMTGADAIVESLCALGVDVVFGIPGGNVIPLYDSLMVDGRVRHILVRHEQAGGFAAEGYACVSGRVGVAIATSGPGATNLVPAIVDAQLNSIPLIALTGQVSSHLLGMDAFQEIDIIEITLSTSKHSLAVATTDSIPTALAAAHLIASTGRPGPVTRGHHQRRPTGFRPFRVPGAPRTAGVRTGWTRLEEADRCCHPCSPRRSPAAAGRGGRRREIRRGA